MLYNKKKIARQMSCVHGKEQLSLKVDHGNKERHIVSPTCSSVE
jgi:hypothetical protein